MPEPGRDHWIAGEWAAAFAHAVEDMAGQHASFEVAGVAALPEPGPSGQFVWKRQQFDIASAAGLSIGASPEARSTVGALVLKAAGIDDADDATIEGTFTEILGQSFGTLVRVLSSSMGGEVRLADSDSASPNSSDPFFAVRLRLGESPPIEIFVAVSTALAEAVDKAARHGDGEQSAEAAAAPDSDGRQKPQFDLLLDVELPVSVSFGRAQLALKDVIKLTTGSIIELNRSVSEPVDVIVNNCVIARGEVVVIEGNFGVRIQHVISRQERLRTLQ